MKKLAYILLILNCTLPIVKAQQIQEWAQIYNGPDNLNDNASDIIHDKFGNVFVTGTNGANPQTSHITTIKYSSAGVQQWTITYDNPNTVSDVASGIILDSIGNIFVLGYTGDLFAQVYDCVLIKYNTNGIQQWTRQYNDIGHNRLPNKILIDKSQNIYIVGTSSSAVMVLKCNQTGDTLWTKRYIPNGYALSYGNAARLDSAGNLIVGGYCSINSMAAADCLIMKYSTIGVLLWTDTLNTGGVNTTDIINDIGIDSIGNIYSVGTGHYYSDLMVMKHNTSGIKQWVKWYNSTLLNGSDYATTLAVANGNLYVAGTTQITFGSNYDYLTIKYNLNGDSVWVRKFDGGYQGDDVAKSIALDNFGNAYVTGVCDSNGYKIKTVKYSLNGNPLWVASHFGNGMKILTDTLNNVYVSGTTIQNGTTDFITIKYSQLSGISPISSEIPNSYHLSQNYPNPFNPTTTIKYSIPKDTKVEIKIYDILGREVRTLVNNFLKTGFYETKFDGSNIANGIYFYKIIAGDFIQSRKMVLVK